MPVLTHTHGDGPEQLSIRPLPQGIGRQIAGIDIPGKPFFPPEELTAPFQ